MYDIRGVGDALHRAVKARSHRRRTKKKFREVFGGGGQKRQHKIIQRRVR